MRKKPKLGDASLRDGFLFLGGHVILDFLNTRPVIAGEVQELLPDFNAWLRWLRAAGLIEERDAVKAKNIWAVMGRKPHTAAAVRGLREALRQDILAWEHGGPVGPATVKRLNWIL